MNEADARRRARASWETRIFRDDPAAEAEADARFWARLSPVDRLLTAWTSSVETYALAHPDAPAVEPRLRRSVVRIVRG